MTTARDLQRSQRSRSRIFDTGKLSPKARTELDQRQPRRVLAHSAIRAVVVTVIDVCEGRGFELGVFRRAS
jgi:hypothetical protein